jgi:CO/xanthine dehydrogenase FAD-binding subunit
MALGAEVTLIGPEGERTIALSEFYQLDGMKKNVLQPGEFMLKVTLPKTHSITQVVIKSYAYENPGIFPRQESLRFGKKATIQL